MLVKNILFDFDGVVVDSEQLHLKAMQMTLAQNGICFPEDFSKQYIGISDDKFFRYVRENLDNRFTEDYLTREKNRIFESIVQELTFIPGFTEFIDEVMKREIPRAVVTSSSIQTVDFYHSLFPFKHYFEVFVCEEDTQTHKPFPEPYLQAMEKLEIDTDATLVIEDSINGIKAGKAAGCTVVGLATSFDPQTLLDAGADCAFHGYSDLRKAIRLA